MAAFEDSVAQELIQRLEAIAPQHDIDIVDVEVVGAQSSPIIRVRIDHLDEDAPGISLDEVTAQTEWISEALDEADPFPGAYTLEVSSPGLSRPLRRPHDYERFAGEEVSLSARKDGKRHHVTGRLKGLSPEGKVVVASDEGTQEFALEEIASCHLKPDFGPKPKPGKQGGRKNATNQGQSKAHESN